MGISDKQHRSDLHGSSVEQIDFIVSKILLFPQNVCLQNIDRLHTTTYNINTFIQNTQCIIIVLWNLELL